MSSEWLEACPECVHRFGCKPKLKGGCKFPNRCKCRTEVCGACRASIRRTVRRRDWEELIDDQPEGPDQ